MERKDKRIHPEDVGARSSSDKRRRHVFTIQQKVKVLRKTDSGVSVSRLHREYGVGQSTIYDIKAQKNQILQYVAESDSMAGILKRKTLRDQQGFHSK
jgi:transposase-like protein